LVRTDAQAKLGSTASTKAVYGICIDELCTHRVASFADSQVYVWDMRNFEKPFVVLSHSKAIAKVGWCPTRYADELLYRIHVMMELSSTFV